LERNEFRYRARSDFLCFHVEILKKLTFTVKSNLELLILELLPFGGFFSHFDLADLDHSSGGLLVLELATIRRITLYTVLPQTAHFAITIPPVLVLVLELVIPEKIIFIYLIHP
jgi:hypothetical protein